MGKIVSLFYCFIVMGNISIYECYKILKLKIIMKKYILLISLITILTNNSFSQENLTFSKIIKADSVSKTELFVVINDWFASNYNSANDVIQMSDKDAGIIIGKGSLKYSYGKLI